MESQADALNQLTSDELEKVCMLESTSVDSDLAELKKELSEAQRGSKAFIDVTYYAFLVPGSSIFSHLEKKDQLGPMTPRIKL
nr:membrane-associated protein VIPP1, chloroplastic [Ipomoea batatas]